MLPLADSQRDSPGPERPFLVAGHVCLDLTPELHVKQFPQPGELIDSGLLRVSTGGAVSNVGFALSRLGLLVRLCGLVGDDWLGELLIKALQPLGDQPGLRMAPGQVTSYSIVVAPPECDRTFLHCAGVNSIFTSADVRDQDLHGAGWLHFGYPPIMPAITADNGRELTALFRRASELGLRTSLDFCAIGPDAASFNWRALLRNCAPYVTVFAPSIQELRVALRQSFRSDDDVSDGGVLVRELFGMGFTIVAIKLGSRGLYLASTDVPARLTRWRLPSDWGARELWAPCFRAQFVNACGAGDCTIAGLIASIANGSSSERALSMALAAGAASVEAPDASGGVRSMAELQARMAAGWERLHAEPPGADWNFDSATGVWSGRKALTRTEARL